MKMGLDPPSHDRGPSIHNSVDHIKNIAPPNAGNLPMPPCRQHVPLNHARDYMNTPVFGLVALQPLLRHAGEIGGARSCQANTRRVASGLGISAGLSPCSPGVSKSEGGVSPKLQPTKAAAMAIKDHPRPVAAVAQPQGKARIA